VRVNLLRMEKMRKLSLGFVFVLANFASLR
jgi:hypothetical protein